MFVRNLSPSERMDRFEKFFFCLLSLGQGKVLGKKKFGFSKKFRIILQNVNTTIGRSPETPDSGKAARG